MRRIADGGIGQKAVKSTLDIAKNDLGLERIYLEVREENVPAVRVYEATSFQVKERTSGKIIMERYLKPG